MATLVFLLFFDIIRYKSTIKEKGASMVRIADFTDYDLIPEEHRAAVEACAENGLMNGTYDGSFNPNGNFTFAELCKIMSVVLNMSNGFSSEKLSQNYKGHWAAQYVEECLELNIIHKRLDIININSYVTRDDAVTTLMNATIFLCNKINLNLENTLSALTNTLHGEDGSKDATRSFLAYCLNIFYVSIADKIYGACVTESPNINFISVAYAEPILRFRFDKITAEVLVLLISRYLCISPNGLTLVRQLLAYRDRELGRHKCTSSFVDHYTSLQTLKCLAEKDACLRLCNAAFLNDPLEGGFFHTSLKGFLKGFSDCGHRYLQSDRLAELIDHTSKPTPFYPNSAYIVSFSNLKGEDDHSSLPMWFQYADHGKGWS